MDQLEACRICVNCFNIKAMDFINIFQPNQEFQQELDFIQGEIRHWQLNINANDGLPQRICAECFAKFCSMEAFRQECGLAQKRLYETLTLQSTSNETDVKHVINNTEAPLPLVGNYGTGNLSLDSGNSVLGTSVNLHDTNVSLNDFPVFDQQFSHYDNPALIDDSSTLLDSNLIAPESTQELGLLPSQNLFTFETAEPPSMGTLPLQETETTSIINDMLVEKPSNDGIIKQDDLEDMLQHSIIPTTNLTQQRSCCTDGQQPNGNEKINLYAIDHAVKVKSEYENTTISFLNHDETNSELEYDDTDIHGRLKGFSYACHYCFCPDAGPIEDLVFANEEALSQHFFDVHDPNRPYTCPKCPQSCKTKLLRDNHVKFIHKIIEFQTCNYCRNRIKGPADVHQYNCQYVGDWECEHCQEKFHNTPLYRFRLHQREHERIKHFKCRSCERYFLKKANLEAHERMHKADAKSNYTCNICKASFIDEYGLKRHKYQQHNAEAPAKCEFCDKGFSSNVFLQRHLNKFHPNSPKNNGNNVSLSNISSASSSPNQHVCLNCNIGFKTQQILHQHLLLGRDSNGNCLSTSCNKEERRRLQRQGVFPCFHCPRRFHLRSQLDKHLNTHDARLRPFQCDQCVMRFRTAVELKQHINVAHLNIKAFSCDKCGKCFGYKKDLREHMLFHAEINVHCTEEGCEYVCKNEKALKDHIRHKHRLLSCEYCNEQFTRQKLTAHLRKTHRSEIDVELAGESDNFYKSQLLNNNNDITQISFNLLNTSQENQQLGKTPSHLPPTSVSSQTLAAATENVEVEAQATASPTHLPSTTSSSLTTSYINSVVTSPSSLSSCLISSTKGNNLSYNSISPHNMIDNNVDLHHGPLCAMFASDCHNSNGTNLTLNSLVSNENDLNLVANDANNMFLLPSGSSSTNDNQLDQYFMASLIDTEQEVIVT